MQAGAEITPYPDGPYLVRGQFVLRGQDGAPIDVPRRTVALCRCGKSRMRPFCDGTHRLIKFRAPSQPEDPQSEPPPQSEPGGLMRSTETDPPPDYSWGEGGGSNGYPSAPRKAVGTVREAERELSRVRASVGRLRQRQLPSSEYKALSAAASLLGAAASVLGSVGAAEDPWLELAPCLCLSRGALTEVMSLPGEAHGELPELVSRLQFLVRLLESGR